MSNFLARMETLLHDIVEGKSFDMKEVESILEKMAFMKERTIRAKSNFIKTVTCRECGIPILASINKSPLDYMVLDEVWEKAGFTPNDFACASCLEKRLGRSLTADDFTDVACNVMVRWALSKTPILVQE